MYWGDTHVHTALSGDGFAGGTRLGLDAAYRFARGEAVISNTGQRAQLSRPLDFMVVADHGNNMGAAYARHAYAEDAGFRDTPLGRLWQQAFAELAQSEDVGQDALRDDPLLPTHRLNQVAVRHAGFRQSIWQMTTAAADRHNDPGRFTAFIGYEWTPKLGATHRVVVFRDGADKADQIVPFTSWDSTHTDYFWDFLDRYEKRVGGAVLAIPHNSNLSFGQMFALTDSYGRPHDLAYAATRAKWEPVVEVTQIKGDSETHPFLSPDDAFADFETWNGWDGVVASPDKPAQQLGYEYARSALKLGLDRQAALGVNPFKFGMIGSSDAHTGLAAVEEDNFFGKSAKAEPNPQRMLNDAAILGWQASAAGLAAVWATANTREAIFAALRRREVYATTGPRITLRFFGGWGFTAADAEAPNMAARGYAGGVPMGQELGACGATAPTFLVQALKDADNADLQRIQIIKGWRSGDGALHEQVHDVALPAERPLAATGASPQASGAVAADAVPGATAGAAQLAAVWRDPGFRCDEPAFYYVRALQVPTPRWTAYDAQRYGIEDVPEHIPMTLQERAYSSPIWYTP